MSIARCDPSHAVPTPASFALPAEPLRLLLEAHECARELGEDAWEFAVEIRCLVEAGMTHTHLRWLQANDYVRQAAEQTCARRRQRVFRAAANLSYSGATCFVLSANGVAYARAAAGGPAPATGLEEPRPFWDQVRRELRVGGALVKRFRQPAQTQELILAAFEEEGWPPRIDDPLPPRKHQLTKRRLHSTITNLNRGQGPGFIRFAGGGDGQSVLWWPAERVVRCEAERGQSECRQAARNG
jgi:hypothetical protein